MKCALALGVALAREGALANEGDRSSRKVAPASRPLEAALAAKRALAAKPNCHDTPEARKPARRPRLKHTVKKKNSTGKKVLRINKVKRLQFEFVCLSLFLKQIRKSTLSRVYGRPPKKKLGYSITCAVN